MTVQTELSRVDFVGNGVTVLFLVPFPFLEDDYLVVIRTNTVTGVETTLILDSIGPDGYTAVAGQAIGTVTVVTPPAATERLSIIRNVPGTQEADFRANDPLPAETFETALDKLTMLIGQIASGYGISRVPLLFNGDVDGAGRYNANGNRIVDLADGVNAQDAATVSQVGDAATSSALFVQAGAGAVARTVQTKLRESASLRDFGAVGDGVSDDTLAVQAAFDSGVSLLTDEGGTYRITDTLTLSPPFCFRGAGSEKTILQFEGRGGFAGDDGLVIGQASAKYQSVTISDMTIAIKGANGRYGIATPTGSVIFNTYPPTYYFERLVFRGTVEDGSLFSLYDYGWQRSVFLGDSRESVIRDCRFMGCYDYTENPATANTNNTAIYISGVNGEGGVLMPVIDHCFIHYHGKAVEFGYRVSNPKINTCQFHRCYQGITSPNTGSGTNYAVLEAQFTDLNINAQLNGVYIAESAYVSAISVRCTRASAGFDHANTWYGFRLDDVSELKMFGCRAYNEGSAYTNTHIGVQVFSGDYADIAGMDIRGIAASGITKGVVVKDMGRVRLSAQFTNCTTGVSFETDTTNTPDASVFAQFSSSVTTQFAYDSGVSRAGINIFTKRDRYEGVDASTTAITAAATLQLTRGVDKQIKRYQFNAGAGPYTYDVQFLNTNASEGDKFVVHTVISATTNPTVRFLDAASTVLLSLNNTTGSTIRYRVEVAYTGAAWRIIGATVSLA